MIDYPFQRISVEWWGMRGEGAELTEMKSKEMGFYPGSDTNQFYITGQAT